MVSEVYPSLSHLFQEKKVTSGPKALYWIVDAAILLDTTLSKFGSFFTVEQLGVLQTEIANIVAALPDRHDTRRPVLLCLASLSACLAEEQFESMMTEHVQRIENSTDTVEFKTHVQV